MSEEPNADAAPPRNLLWPELPGDWFVVHARSRQEKALHDDLRKADVPSFLPLMREARTYGHRKEIVDLPLFSGYVFVKGTKRDIYDADPHRRKVAILDVPDQDLLAWELESLRNVLGGAAAVSEVKRLVSGTPVEVRSGAFRGHQGVVERLKSPQRLLVQLHYFQRAMSLDLDVCDVVPLRD